MFNEDSLKNQLRSNQTDVMTSPKRSGHCEITTEANIFETWIGVAGPVEVACLVATAWTDQGSNSCPTTYPSPCAAGCHGHGHGRCSLLPIIKS